MADAGYSGAPLGKKLGIKPGSQILLVDAPPGFPERLGPLPERAMLTSEPATDLDLIVLFVTRQAELAAQFSALAGRLAPAGMLWVAWPKRASGRPTDLSFDAVQSTGLAAGLVDTKIAAIDEVWSALRFVIRLRDRPKGHSPHAK